MPFKGKFVASGLFGLILDINRFKGLANDLKHFISNKQYRNPNYFQLTKYRPSNQKFVISKWTSDSIALPPS